MKIILPGLTTTPDSDWREKTSEIDKLGLKEIALFPTFIGSEDRKELYNLLEKTKLKSIPHVHLRDEDMEEWELDLLINKYSCKFFNIHPNAVKIFQYKKYLKMMYVENLQKIDERFFSALDKVAGICLDVSHYEDYGVISGERGYENFSEVLKKYPIGCCHISAVKSVSQEAIDYLTHEKSLVYSYHKLSDLKELDYVKKYVQYLPEYVSIELENSFLEQIKVKEYLDKIIN